MPSPAAAGRAPPAQRPRRLPKRIAWPHPSSRPHVPRPPRPRRCSASTVSRYAPGRLLAAAQASARAFSGASPPRIAATGERGSPASSGATNALADDSVGQHHHLVVPGDGQLVQSLAMHQPGMRWYPAADSVSAIGRAQAGSNTPVSCRVTPAGICQRTQQVEDRAGAQLHPRPGRMAECRVVPRREQEHAAGLAPRRRATAPAERPRSHPARSARPPHRSGTTRRGCRAWPREAPGRPARRSRPSTRSACRRHRPPCRIRRSRPAAPATETMRASMARTAPVSSATVSPRTRIIISRPAICAGVASPDMMMPNAASASASDSVSPPASRAMTGLRLADHSSTARTASAGALAPRAIARKLARMSWPCSRGDAFRVELHAEHRQRAMAQAHHHARRSVQAVASSTRWQSGARSTIRL